MPGLPVPWSRPRGTNRFETTTLRAWKEEVADAACLHADIVGTELPIQGKVAITILVVYPSGTGPTVGTDLDNVAKGIFDGFNGVVWRDDSQKQLRKVVIESASTDDPFKVGTHITVERYVEAHEWPVEVNDEVVMELEGSTRRGAKAAQRGTRSSKRRASREF